MKLDTVWGCNGDSLETVAQAIKQLEASLGSAPDMVFFHGAQGCNPQAIMNELTAQWPSAHIHAGSSCLGVMIRDHFEANPQSFGLLGIVDPAGAYGVGCAILGADPRTAVQEALHLALEHSGRPGEIPLMLMLTAPPGREEELLLGIEEIVGPNVPVTGGSAGDDVVTGHWWIGTNGMIGNDLVAVTAMFPSGGVISSFQSGYEATKASGRITRASGRLLYEIDGRPAAAVYNEWTNNAIADVVEAGGKIPQRISALYPVGRRVGSAGHVSEFVLSFLDTVLPDGSLLLFTSVEEGEQLLLMRGTDDSLVDRAGHVASFLIDSRVQERGYDDIIGGIVIFCGACLVHVRDRMPEVVTKLDAALGDRPYLGTFTFGEQGCFLSSGNRHGNLMVVVILFTQPAIEL